LTHNVKLLSTVIAICAEAAVLPVGVANVLRNATFPVGAVVSKSGSASQIHDAEDSPLSEKASLFPSIRAFSLNDEGRACTAL
jgi:hypothetical protein